MIVISLFPISDCIIISIVNVVVIIIKQLHVVLMVVKPVIFKGFINPFLLRIRLPFHLPSLHQGNQKQIIFSTEQMNLVAIGVPVVKV